MNPAAGVAPARDTAEAVDPGVASAGPVPVDPKAGKLALEGLHPGGSSGTGG